MEGLKGLLLLAGELMSAPSEMASFDTMIPEEAPLQLTPAPSGLTGKPWRLFLFRLTYWARLTGMSIFIWQCC